MLAEEGTLKHCGGEETCGKTAGGRQEVAEDVQEAEKTAGGRQEVAEDVQEAEETAGGGQEGVEEDMLAGAGLPCPSSAVCPVNSQ